MKSFFTNRRDGSSQGDYSSANLALHVGDEVNHVIGNRAKLRSSFAPLVFMNQVHGDSIAVIDEIPLVPPTCDALITSNTDISLVVMVADCIPLLLSTESLVAAVHVGRAGLVNSIAVKTVNRMFELGATQITANIGPSICGKCYEVPLELHNDVSEIFPLASSRTRIGSYALDLPKALTGQLENLGVKVITEAVCTFENNDYFSYRKNKQTGRQGGVIQL